MKKINLVLVAIAATALLWCLDRATGTSEADTGCECGTVTIRTVINEHGESVVDANLLVDLTSTPVKIPMLVAYSKRGGILESIPFEIDEHGGITVRGQPGTVVYVAVLR